ncbi:MAG: hypothetical protein ABIH86_03120 [Planctomycetota bacterium]
MTQQYSSLKEIVIKKQGHIYKYLYFQHEELAAVRAMVADAGREDLNLSLNDVIPYIHYLGYDLNAVVYPETHTQAA